MNEMNLSHSEAGNAVSQFTRVHAKPATFLQAVGNASVAGSALSHARSHGVIVVTAPDDATLTVEYKGRTLPTLRRRYEVYAD